jgi:hypothetical protein
LRTRISDIRGISKVVAAGSASMVTCSIDWWSANSTRRWWSGDGQFVERDRAGLTMSPESIPIST